jgi:hypothetical protein
MMARVKRAEYLKSIVDFFHSEGKVYLRSEYIALGETAPVPYKMFQRLFNGNYNKVLKLMQRDYPVEWASIGSVLIEEPKKVTAPVVESNPEPAEESDLSPLEKLRMAKGESYE